MKFGVYSIRDSRTGFLAPTVEVSDSVAARNFEHAILRSGDSLFTTHPEDYHLYKLGEMDSETGALDGLVPPSLLLSARSIFDRLGGVQNAD